MVCIVTPRCLHSLPAPYGESRTYYDVSCKLFQRLPVQSVSWMSHSDYIDQVPEGFVSTAHTDTCPSAAIADERRGFYGVQFHPEVGHTEHGVAVPIFSRSPAITAFL